MQKEVPNLMPFQFQPFNGDTFIEEEFLKLKQRFDITKAVETGTCLGSTTMFLAKHFKEVITIEVNEEFRNHALARFEGNTDTTVNREAIISLHGDSKVMVDGVIKVSKLSDDTIFFLDAHWEKNCPLAEELQAIALNKIKPVIAIHDFKVPGHPELGFDHWNGKDLDFSLIEPLLNDIYGKGGYGYHYNTTKNSTTVKRGIIYIYPKVANKAPVADAQPNGVNAWPGEVINAPKVADERFHPKVSLYINYYQDSNADRQQELDETLKQNILCPGVDRIYAIVESKDHVEYLKSLSDKIHVVEQEGRPTYRDFFRIINEKIETINEISIIANLDIFITPTVAALVKKHMKKPICMALSAWDYTSDGRYVQHKKNIGEDHFVPKSDAQDAWVFKGKIRQDIKNIDFCLGKPGCDNAIAERLNQAGYKVTNPSNDIRPVHYHLINVRNYDTRDVSDKTAVNPDRIEKPYLILPPVSINQIPFCHDDLWPEYASMYSSQEIITPGNWVEEIEGLKNVTGGESQFAEDAIIAHIFNHVGTDTRFFVDLGAGAYEGSTMSNTRTLKRKGWIGFGVDAKPTKDPWVMQGFITPERIVETLASKKTPMFFDFLNLDIDSSDYWVLRKILEAGYRPRLICTEFNGTLPPDIPVALKYEKGYTWDGTNKYGYSFAAGKKLLEKYGYEVICNLHDTDLFAVQKRYLKDVEFNPVTSKPNMYHPVNPTAQWEQV